MPATLTKTRRTEYRALVWVFDGDAAYYELAVVHPDATTDYYSGSAHDAAAAVKVVHALTHRPLVWRDGPESDQHHRFDGFYTVKEA